MAINEHRVYRVHFDDSTTLIGAADTLDEAYQIACASGGDEIHVGHDGAVTNVPRSEWTESARDAVRASGVMIREALEHLRAQAGAALDSEDVALYESALAGDTDALRECARAIDAAMDDAEVQTQRAPAAVEMLETVPVSGVFTRGAAGARFVEGLRGRMSPLSEMLRRRSG